MKTSEINAVVWNMLLLFVVTPFLAASNTSVQLVEFNAKIHDCNVHLYWSTELPETFQVYEIEKSYDGVIYNRVGRRYPVGLAKNDYDFVDEFSKDHNYYRLKMINLDGNIEYSEVLMIIPDCDRPPGVTEIYPNPVFSEIGMLNIRNYAMFSDKADFIIADIHGTTIRNFTIKLSKGWNTIRLNVADFTGGAYVLKQLGISNNKAIPFVIAN